MRLLLVFALSFAAGPAAADDLDEVLPGLPAAGCLLAGGTATSGNPTRFVDETTLFLGK